MNPKTEIPPPIAAAGLLGPDLVKGIVGPEQAYFTKNVAYTSQ